MSDIRVAQVLESDEPQAGSAALAVLGLEDALGARGVRVMRLTAAACARSSVTECDVESSIRESTIVHVFGWGGPFLSRVLRTAVRASKPIVLTPFGALSASPGERQSIVRRALRWWRDRSVLRGVRVITAINEFERHALLRRAATVEVAIVPTCAPSVAVAGRAGAVDGEPVGVGLAGATIGARGAAPGPSAEVARAFEGGAPRALREARVCVAGVRATLAPGRVLLVLGPIHPAEGLVTLLKAFAECGPSAEGWNVVLAGPEVGPWRAQLAAAVTRKGASDRVAFASASTPEEQAAWLESAALLACTPSVPRCPVSVVQGLAARVPVVATHPVVPAGLEASLRVCAPTKAEIREALREHLSLDEADLREIAAEASAKCAARLDPGHAADSLVQLYRDVV